MMCKNNALWLVVQKESNCKPLSDAFDQFVSINLLNQDEAREIASSTLSGCGVHAGLLLAWWVRLDHRQ